MTSGEEPEPCSRGTCRFRSTCRFPQQFGGVGIDEGYGYSVSAEQDYVIIGFPFTGPNGAIEVLERSGSSFASATVPPVVFGPGQLDARAGASVSIGSNGSVAIGQPGADGNNEVDGGTVRVWDDIASLPVTEDTIDSGSDSQQDQLGFTVAVDGNRMAVTAVFDDEPNPRSGSVQIFERSTPFDPWTFAAIVRDPNPTDNGRFGDALALNGNTLAVGKSDRWGSQTSPGEVSVFTVSGSVWSLSPGTPLTSGLGTYDGFGASLALPDENTLMIGAPASGGSGAVFFSTNPGGWSIPTAVTYSTPPAAGDQLGFSLDSYETGTGHILAVGAPGDDNAGPDAGGVWIHDVTGGVPTLLNVIANDAFWDNGDRVGSSVAADHGRIVVAGAGNQNPGADFQAHVIEFNGAVWDIIWSTSTTLSIAVDGVPNDYVDIYGGTVALGRPGGGGQVEIFRADGSLNGFALTPDDVLMPSATTPGDRVGHSVDIDGRTLAAGAPGDDLAGDSTGAVFAVSVPIVATFTGAVDSAWDVPGNWDVGVVPEPSDTAVVPIAGFVEVDSFVEASVIVSSEGQVNVLAGGTFVPYSDWSGTPSRVEGTIEIQSGGSLTLVADNALALAGGTISNLAGGAVRFEAFDEPIAIAGIGNWFNSGALIKDGPAVADIEEGITWTSDVTSDINVLASGLTFFMPVFEEGSVTVEADASVSYLDDFSATSGVVLTVAIEGPGPSTTEHGTFYFDSFDPPGFGFATLRTVGGYAPVGGDVYDVISCYDCGSPELIYDIGSLVPFVAGITGFDFIQLAAPSEIVVDTLDGFVASDSNCSLPEAVQAANTDLPVDACPAGSDSATDTIVFDVSGPIQLVTAIDPIDTDVIIDGSGQGITISGRSSTSIMSVDVGGSVDLLEVTITDGIRQDCFDGDGCGAVLNQGILNVAWVTFSGNRSSGGGGAAITNDLGGQANISYSTFVDNTSSTVGGAIWNKSGNVEITNSTFVDHFSVFGGAVHNDVAPATTVITNSTFSNNGAEIGVIQNANTDPGSLLLRNTIIESASGFDCAGTITADGFNIDSDGSCDSATTSLSLNLEGLADNGGATQTVALGAGSAAYNAADLAVCTASPVFGVDQRGQVRPQGTGCDSGAYESNGTAGPAAITIDTVADDNVVNGNCTLREAILAANSNAVVDACSAGTGPDTIAFDLSGPTPYTISPTSPLPPITEPLAIDAYSQPGASANTLAVGSDAVILIELDGSSAGGGANGLDFSDFDSDGSVVQGLAINGFDGSGVVAGPGTQVRGNFIGTNVAGTAAVPNGTGITANSPASPAATIGGTAPSDRNVISGNDVRGIYVIADTGDLVGTTILGNYIGTDADGTTAVPNVGEGIWLGNSVSLVSGTVIGDGTDAGRNVVSGNGGEGIALWTNSPNTTIRGNYIGVGADGATPLGNALSACGMCFGGLVIRNSTSNNTIGGNLPGDGNVIANNPTGIVAFSGVNNRVVGNSIYDNLGRGLEIGVVGPNDSGDGMGAPTTARTIR